MTKAEEEAPKFYDEMLDPDGTVAMAYAQYAEWLDGCSKEFLDRKNDQADLMFRRLGITFTVYGDDQATERLIPFDIIPRILDPKEWDFLSRGAIQRVDALNAFLDDVYHDQAILKAGRIPPELVLNNDAYRPEMLDLDLPRRIYGHIAGVDVVRRAAPRQRRQYAAPDLRAYCRR